MKSWRSGPPGRCKASLPSGCDSVLKILVTGGGGFLGTAICRQLTADGHAVIAYQRSDANHLNSEGLAVIRGDICDPSGLREASRGCDAIVHTAGKAGVWGDASEYHRVNVDGTANVLETCRQNGIRCLVHTSSPSVVHAGGDVNGADTKQRATPLMHAAQTGSVDKIRILAEAGADPEQRDSSG